MAQGDLNFLEDIKRINCEKEEFENIISVFSRFVSRTNGDYYYNETYLPTFVGDFLLFKRYLELKENIFVKISGAFFTKKTKVHLTVDSCFMFEDEEIEIRNHYDLKRICSNDIVIKIEYQKGERREIEIIKKKVIENDEICWDVVNKVLEEIIKKVETWDV